MSRSRTGRGRTGSELQFSRTGCDRRHRDCRGSCDRRVKTRGAKRAISLPVSVPVAYGPDAARPLSVSVSASHRSSFDTPQVRDIYTVDVRKHGDAAMIFARPCRTTREACTLDRNGTGHALRRCTCDRRVRTGSRAHGLNRRIEKNKEIAMLAIEDPESLAPRSRLAQPMKCPNERNCEAPVGWSPCG